MVTMQPNTQQLDQQALNLAKAIRRAETGTTTNPYHASGASGERGAYQFMPDTWKGWAGQYLGNPNADMSVENQNKVAYSRIKELKDQGMTPAQIASSWNSGNKDAYKQGHSGINDKGVAYNTPEYVAKVSDFYREISGKGSNTSTGVGGSYSQPPQVEPFTPSNPTAPLAEEKSFGRKAAEFVFPILEKKERTALQTVGDLGLSAMSLAPGFGAAGLGAKATLMGAKSALKGVVPSLLKKSTIAKGGAIGYGADVLSNLAEGDTGLGTLTPGVGTVLGIGGGVGLQGLRGTKLGQKALDDELYDKASAIVSPMLTKKNVREGLKSGLGSKTGSKVDLDDDYTTQRAAESILDLVRKGAIKTTDTVEKKANVIRKTIGDTAKDLENRIDALDIKPVLTSEELGGLIQKTKRVFDESPLLVGDAGKAAERIFNKFVSFLPKGTDITASELLRARKKLDTWMREEGRSAAFDPKMENAISKGLREIRQGANDLIKSKSPGVPVEEMLEKQSALYDALDAVIENSWREVGTTGRQRYFQRHPFQKEMLKTTAATVGAGTIGGYLGTKLVGD